jgi:hypothetical protein
MRETRGHGRRHDHHDYYLRHPVMTPDMIRQLPGQHALVIRGGYSPVVARLPMAWKDRTYKSARGDGTAPAAPASIPDPAEFTIEIPEPRTGGPDWDTEPDSVPGGMTLDDPARYPWQ